ncbi:hypothetical protein, partial [Mycobacterium sp.]|uniref:hypothetical protein n=1 Tax=Mycobacterium sp. TaxID=1785 RepID=UPI002BA63356
VGRGGHRDPQSSAAAGRCPSLTALIDFRRGAEVCGIEGTGSPLTAALCVPRISSMALSSRVALPAVRP